ncbi:hypothetical protein [Sagittula sp. MA-2]|uniref:hypothetical protein n=1 Tax=Sagittula sp. MA-2 TaxID=3048007 RepID=UPI0024C3BC66|nr:hypothetical protein [Sagittula sp. MA-2]WHZ37713.1 hypothetical protein QNI11_22870 [Sagittula sp. MA-2]
MQNNFATSIFATHDLDRYAILKPDSGLHYSLERHKSGQAVTNARLKATPCIDFSRYKFETNFDWIKVGVTLPQPHLPVNVARSIKNALSEQMSGGIYVRAGDGGGVSSRELTLQIFDPNYRRVAAVLALLVERYGLEGTRGAIPEHRFLGFELALDAFPRVSKVQDEAELVLRRVQMTDLLRKHFMLEALFTTGDFATTRDLLRCYNETSLLLRLGSDQGKLAPKVLFSSLNTALCLESHFQMPIDSTVYVGAVEREMRYKIYDKIKDRMKNDAEKTYVALSPEECCSRIEVTLDGMSGSETVPQALGLDTISSIGRFKWEALRTILFNFVLPTFAVDDSGSVCSTELAIFRRTGAFGLNLHQRAKSLTDDRMSPLGPRGRMIAYDKLNERIARKMKETGRKFCES